MYKQSMNVVKGVGLGIAAGAAVAAVSSAMMNGGKKSAKAIFCECAFREAISSASVSWLPSASD